MAYPQVLITLRRKQAEIENAIAAYEKRAAARRDLAAINAATRIFDVNPGAEHVTSYKDVYRLFKRGEQIAICKAALPCAPSQPLQKIAWTLALPRTRLAGAAW